MPPKFAIYEIHYTHGVKIRKWGVPPPSRTNYEVRIIQSYILHTDCSAEFHAYERIMASMKSIYKRAERIGADAVVLTAMAGILDNAGWPEIPVIPTMVERARLIHALLSDVEIKKMLPATRPAISMNETEMDEFRAAALAAGFTPRA